MIKCPHCGSTAQTKRISDPIISKKTNHLLIGYKCGCGCHFEVEYAENEKGIFFYYATFVTYAENEFTETNKGHIHCPCNGTDCPYWKDGICSLYSEEENWADPWEECSDFGMFWDEYDDYIDYD